MAKKTDISKTARQEWQERYDFLKKAGVNYRSTELGQAIIELAHWSLHFLNRNCSKILLISKIVGKKYHSYTFTDNKSARPANSAFFDNDEERIAEQWKNTDKLTKSELQNMLYTIALAPCLARDLFDRNDKKSSATYFEYFIGHLFAKKFGVNPAAQESFCIENKKVSLPTDFLFKTDSLKIHMPVKTSTRERVVQAWTHQRILNEQIQGGFKGMLIIFSETKLDAKTHEVVEICVPDQWLIYQRYLAKIDNIYYFDLPEKYRQLRTTYPNLFCIGNIADAF
jgi:hypothetical protein